MDNPQALTPLRASDYEAIEAAVMETEKGRWFLAEYANRHRAANTDEILGAIGRLEGMLKRERRPDADRIRLDIGEMKDAIERTKLEIAQIKTDGHSPLSRFDRASNELDAIVEQTEAATSEILGAAEKVQEIAFTMREGGVDDQFCDEIENLTTTIYMACSFQDLTGQRTQKVVQVLRYLENRINAMIEIWGMDEKEVSTSSAKTRTTTNPLDRRPDAHLLNGPALAGEGIEQNIVDDLLHEDEAADEAALDVVTNHAIDNMDFERIEAMTALDPTTQADKPLPEIPMDADGQIDFDAIVIDEDEPAQSAAELADTLHFDPVGAAASADGASEASDADHDAAEAGVELDLESEVDEPLAEAPESEPEEVEMVADAVTDDTEDLTEAEDGEPDASDDESVEAAVDDSAETTATEAEPNETDAQAVLDLASEAMDEAIDALKEVSELAKAKTPVSDATDDPFDKMTKTERQALFS